MQRITVSDLGKRLTESVVLEGWVQTIRAQKRMTFLILRDITGAVQAVTGSDHPLAQRIKDLTIESVVRVEGQVKSEAQAPGGIEVILENVEVLSAAEPMLPIPVVDKAGEVEQSKRLDWRWLDLRKSENQRIFKVWTTMEHAFRQYCVDAGYLEIHSPKLMSTSSESGAELFEVRYFNRKAYLAQSPQFYKQMAMASGFERVFETGPVFRADPSFTSRHTTEFTGYDIEISFVRSHHDVMAEEERIVIAMLQAIKERHGEEIRRSFNQEVTVPTLPFPKLEFREAKGVVKRLGVRSERPTDLSPEEERALGEFALAEYGHPFLFVSDYPAAGRPFYHMRSETDGLTTKSFDLLFKGVEITTGAQREHRYAVLLAQVKEMGLRAEPLQFYLNFFRFGCPPHGGLGFGPARFVMQVLGLPNIRDVTLLPRTVNRLDP